jgi:Holliday junction resolvase RusA-like endonuclease
MKPIELTINQEPVAKGRPKFAIRNGVGSSYTPTKTQNAQERLQEVLAKEIYPLPPHKPLKLTVVLYRAKPKWPPTSREKMPFRKPDADNFLKLVLDALGMRKIKYRIWENGEWQNKAEILTPIIPDDAQFTTIITAKRWSPNGQGMIKLRIEDDTEEV